MGSNSNTVGQQSFSTASQYDTLFKDVIVNSEFRNSGTSANNYTITFNKITNQIFKAELIEVYIPSTTDTSINITPTSNRLYFKYVGPSDVYGFIVIQPGSYLSPQALGREIQRQLDIFFSNAISPTLTYGFNVTYNVNLNRYIFTDRYLTNSIGSIQIYKKDEVVPGLGTISNSIANVLKLYTSSSDSALMSSNHIIINPNNNVAGLLKPSIATSGEYGQYSDGSTTTDIPLTSDIYFGNSIVSDVVLTNCKIFLSLGDTYASSNDTILFGNGPTNTTISDVTGKQVFCQVPTNSPASSASVKTLLNQPNFYSCTQYYNPTITNVTTFQVNWYDEYGNSLNNILEHCFTIRFYYYLKSNPNTNVSIPSLLQWGN